MSQEMVELIKTGGIVGGAILTLAIFVIMLKYLVPLLKPTNGTGSVLLAAIKQLAELPQEVKVLSTQIEGYSRTIKEHVWTRAEMMTEFEKNRHDVANKIMEPLAELAFSIDKVADGIKLLVGDRRVKQIIIPKRKDRRKK